MDISKPQIIQETEDYAVVFKPPKMHSVSLADTEKNENIQKKLTLQQWFKDGYLMHRLDYETHGLVLFAKNNKSYEFFKDLQDRGGFTKEYSAITSHIPLPNTQSDGYPQPPIIDLNTVPKTIMSYFRAYGKGRKLVRPVIAHPVGANNKTKRQIAKDDGVFYRTEIIRMEENETRNIFTLRIKRGFRHQIRCHLSWIGYPILSDPLYNSAYNHDNNEENILALRAHALFFTDPENEEPCACRIPSL